MSILANRYTMHNIYIRNDKLNKCIKKFIIFAADPPYLNVNDVNDIICIEGQMPLSSLLKGIRYQHPKKES